MTRAGLEPATSWTMVLVKGNLSAGDFGLKEGVSKEGGVIAEEVTVWETESPGSESLATTLYKLNYPTANNSGVTIDTMGFVTYHEQRIKTNIMVLK